MTIFNLSNGAGREQAFNSRSKGTALIGVLAPLNAHLEIELNKRWYEAYEAAGLNVALIPVGNEGLDDIVNNIDGLLLPGGNSHVYVDGTEYEFGSLDIKRDLYAAELLKLTRERGVPTLGICRGMQEMLAAYGGTLKHLGDTQSHHALADKDYGDKEKMSAERHSILIQKGGILPIIYNALPELRVNSAHKYGMPLGDWLSGTVKSVFRLEAISDDGIVEAISALGHPFFVGVQYHAELRGHEDMIQDFVYHIRQHHIAEARRGAWSERLLEAA